MPMAMYNARILGGELTAAQVKSAYGKTLQCKTVHDQPWQDGHGWLSSYNAAWITFLQTS